ncbi:MAG: hypothetical protein ABEJ26_08790 [Halosimplex sp.]
MFPVTCWPGGVSAFVPRVAVVALQQSGGSGLLSNPWFYAAFSALSLVVGSAVGIWISPARNWQAILLAVGGGSLVVSLAFELFEPSFKHIGEYPASGYFLAGIVVFGALDVAVDRWADDQTQEEGVGLWASVTTDGIPENAAMGSLLTSGVHGALALLFGLAVTNASQSMMSGTNMSETHGNWKTMVGWAVTAVVVSAFVIVGYRYLPPLPDYWIAAIRAFAAGAILSGLAGEIYPDAYEDAGPVITFATAVGFLGTFLL